MCYLPEETAISHADTKAGLVVVLLLQEAFGVLRLDDDLLDGVIVHAEGHHMAVGPLVVGEGVGGGDVAVVVVVAAEEVELLVAGVFDGMQDVVGDLAASGHGRLADQGARIGREALVVLVLVPCRDEVGVAEVTVVEVAAHHEAVGFVVELGRADDDGAFHVLVLAGLGELIGDDVVIKGVAHIAAHAPVEVGNAVVVDAQGACQVVGHAELIARRRAVLHPVGVVEHIGVEGRHHDGLIAPVAELPPQADTCLMPGAGQDVELAFGTVASEELRGQVGIVGLSYRHHDVTHTDVEALAERLLEPELFECHFAAAFDLVFEFAGLFCLNFHGYFAAAMLKLDFATHAPTLAEVVAQVDDDMGQVDATMALGVFVPLGMGIAEHVVAIKVAGVDGLAVTANGQARFRRDGILCLQRADAQCQS